MRQVFVNLGKRSYKIFIGKKLLSGVGDFLGKLVTGRRVLVVTDSNVRPLYGKQLEESLSAAGIETVWGVIPAGEESKTLEMASRMYDLAVDGEIDRQSPVVALGGGVVGDLAGFVAATYMRGVPFVQVPTTLLAQVDSSVGGKVAVNHPRGKNIIGAFYQPLAVFIDLNTLETLPKREVRAGLAEVIKYGIIRDNLFFGWLEKNIDKFLLLDYAAVESAVKTSCQIKAGIVSSDEREAGLRAVLNFGHTVGHALETVTFYKKYRHGEAVSIGMAAAARIANEMGLFQDEELARVETLLKNAGLPTEIPPEISRSSIIDCIYHDKKVIGGKLTFILPKSIGYAEVYPDFPRNCLEKTIKNHK